jgi:hypothetical protein
MTARPGKSQRPAPLRVIIADSACQQPMPLAGRHALPAGITVLVLPLYGSRAEC